LVKISKLFYLFSTFFWVFHLKLEKWWNFFEVSTYFPAERIDGEQTTFFSEDSAENFEISNQCTPRQNTSDSYEIPILIVSAVANLCEPIVKSNLFPYIPHVRSVYPICLRVVIKIQIQYS
jgi:hypothetical protein